MKKIILTILILSLSRFLVFGQENYIPGYIVKGNDTIRGLINYQGWTKNPDKISFRQNGTNLTETYTPSSIAEFGVKDEIYVSAIVEFEASSANVADLGEDRQLALRSDTVFLETLIKGEKSLYLYKNMDSRENYYIKQGLGYELLVYKKYVENNGSSSRIKENGKYKGQLVTYLGNSLSIQIGQTAYKRGSLTKLFDAYYNSSASSSTNTRVLFQRAAEKIRLEFGILAGTSYTSVSISSKQIDEYNHLNLKPSLRFSGGVSCDLILPRNLNKLSFYNELMFTSFGMSSSVENYTNENDYRLTHYRLAYSYLKLGNLIRYSFPAGKYKLFVNAGISHYFVVSKTDEKKTTTHFYSDVHESQEPIFEESRSYEFAWVVGAGAKHNKFSLQARYEQGTGMANYTMIGSSTKRIFLLLGYSF